MMIQTFGFHFPIIMTSVGWGSTTPLKEADWCYLRYWNMISCPREKVNWKPLRTFWDAENLFWHIKSDSALQRFSFQKKKTITQNKQNQFMYKFFVKAFLHK